MITAEQHFINQTANLLGLREVVALLCQHYKGIFTDKANQHCYHQSGCVNRETHMLAMAHIKQGKGEMLPRNSRQSNFLPALTHTYGDQSDCMSRIHGKMEIRLNHGKAAQTVLIKLQ